MKKLVSFSFYLFFFAGISFQAPFIVLYYQELGFTGTQIGLLSGILPLITLMSVPGLTRLADATRKHRQIMSIALLVVSAGVFLIPALRTFLPILLLGIMINAFIACIPSFSDSATMFMLGDQKEMYSRLRLGGTLGFGFAAPLAGFLVENHGLKLAFWGASALFFLGFLVSQKFEYQSSGEEHLEKGHLTTLLSNPRWVLFLVLAFSAGLSFASVNNYFFPYMKELGIKESVMGIAMFVSTLAEIPIMFFGNRLLKRIGINGLLLLGMTMSGLRPLLYAFSSTLVPILLAQLLNGLAFPLVWIAGVAFAEKNAPNNLKTSAQGLMGAMIFGVGSAAGGFFGGVLFEKLSGQGMFGVFGGVVLGVTLVVALIQRHRPEHAAS